MKRARLNELSDRDFAERVNDRRAKRMKAVDDMPSEIRELVHDYGLNVVKAIIDQGVTKPNKIRHIVETVLNDFSPTRGNFSSQGTSAPGNTKEPTE